MERLSSCIRCVKGTPSGRPFWGYIFVRNVQSLLTAWGGIIFAGIITYEALRVTDCLPPDDTRACSRKSSDDEEDDTPNCRRLWGLVAPEALLTVIATAGAVVLALCSAFVGNYMDSTPYRRQIAMCGTCLVAIFTFICAAIVAPSEEVLLLCSVSLFILSCLKEILNMTIESYAPELSSISTEVAAAITSANLWYYVTMTAWLLVFAIVGTGLSSSTFGFASALITGTFIIIFAFGAFSRLPNVPAAHLPPNDLSVVEASLIQLKSLAKRTYKDYPDLGLVLVAIMFFDPALQAVFTVAIQVLIGAYHFTSQDIPIIFLCAVVVSVPGIAFSKFVTSTTLWEYIEKTDLVPSDLPIESVTVETEFGSSLEIIESIPTPVMRHPGRILICLRGGLITVISVTIMAPFILQPCNIGLAILVGCMWSFCLCFNWNCSSMLRAALVLLQTHCTYLVCIK